MNNKFCNICKRFKDKRSFGRNRNLDSGLHSWCKPCLNTYTTYYHKTHPWLITLHNIRRRCTNSKHETYKFYGGRGIKCLISSQELQVLWYQAEAYNMEHPSIDRIDNNDNYTFENCRYIEMKENLKRRNCHRP